ncbi:hect type ubiquitin [Cyclospora cayetanensis]|uniref:Hect type ubiquitin n=1 Tax=Cyclospora cayetanensis TaxID=88456 RepID=A0A1D3CQW9_9EIME|nr:hect type ubiquitin [Cyclospora cayetanensis]
MQSPTEETPGGAGIRQISPPQDTAETADELLHSHSGFQGADGENASSEGPHAIPVRRISFTASGYAPVGAFYSAADLDKTAQYDEDLFVSLEASRCCTFSAPVVALAAKHAAQQAALTPKGVSRHVERLTRVYRQVDDLLLDLGGLIDPDEAVAAEAAAAAASCAASADPTVGGDTGSPAPAGLTDETPVAASVAAEDTKLHHKTATTSTPTSDKNDKVQRRAIKSSYKKLRWMCDGELQRNPVLLEGATALKCCVFREAIDAVLRKGQRVSDLPDLDLPYARLCGSNDAFPPPEEGPRTAPERERLPEASTCYRPCGYTASPEGIIHDADTRQQRLSEGGESAAERRNSRGQAAPAEASDVQTSISRCLPPHEHPGERPTASPLPAANSVSLTTSAAQRNASRDATPATAFTATHCSLTRCTGPDSQENPSEGWQDPQDGFRCSRSLLRLLLHVAQQHLLQHRICLRSGTARKALAAARTPAAHTTATSQATAEKSPTAGPPDALRGIPAPSETGGSGSHEGSRKRGSSSFTRRPEERSVVAHRPSDWLPPKRDRGGTPEAGERRVSIQKQHQMATCCEGLPNLENTLIDFVAIPTCYGLAVVAENPLLGRLQQNVAAELYGLLLAADAAVYAHPKLEQLVEAISGSSDDQRQHQHDNALEEQQNSCQSGFLPQPPLQPFLRVVETPHPYSRLHAAGAEEAAAAWASSRGVRLSRRHGEHFFYVYHVSFPSATHVILLFDPKSETEGPHDTLTTAAMTFFFTVTEKPLTYNAYRQRTKRSLWGFKVYCLGQQWAIPAGVAEAAAAAAKAQSSICTRGREGGNLEDWHHASREDAAAANMPPKAGACAAGMAGAAAALLRGPPAAAYEAQLCGALSSLLFAGGYKRERPPCVRRLARLKGTQRLLRCGEAVKALTGDPQNVWQPWQGSPGHDRQNTKRLAPGKDVEQVHEGKPQHVSPLQQHRQEHEKDLFLESVEASCAAHGALTHAQDALRAENAQTLPPEVPVGAGADGWCQRKTQAAFGLAHPGTGSTKQLAGLPRNVLERDSIQTQGRLLRQYEERESLPCNAAPHAAEDKQPADVSFRQAYASGAAVAGAGARCKKSPLYDFPRLPTDLAAPWREDLQRLSFCPENICYVLWEEGILGRLLTRVLEAAAAVASRRGALRDAGPLSRISGGVVLSEAVGGCHMQKAIKAYCCCLVLHLRMHRLLVALLQSLLQRGPELLNVEADRQNSSSPNSSTLRNSSNWEACVKRHAAWVADRPEFAAPVFVWWAGRTLRQRVVAERQRCVVAADAIRRDLAALPVDATSEQRQRLQQELQQQQTLSCYSFWGAQLLSKAALITRLRPFSRLPREKAKRRLLPHSLIAPGLHRAGSSTAAAASSALSEGMQFSKGLQDADFPRALARVLLLVATSDGRRAFLAAKTPHTPCSRLSTTAETEAMRALGPSAASKYARLRRCKKQFALWQRINRLHVATELQKRQKQDQQESEAAARSIAQGVAAVFFAAPPALAPTAARALAAACRAVRAAAAAAAFTSQGSTDFTESEKRLLMSCAGAAASSAAAAVKAACTAAARAATAAAGPTAVADPLTVDEGSLASNGGPLQSVPHKQNVLVYCIGSAAGEAAAAMVREVTAAASTLISAVELYPEQVACSSGNAAAVDTAAQGALADQSPPREGGPLDDFSCLTAVLRQRRLRAEGRLQGLDLLQHALLALQSPFPICLLLKVLRSLGAEGPLGVPVRSWVLRPVEGPPLATSPYPRWREENDGSSSRHGSKSAEGPCLPRYPLFKAYEFCPNGDGGESRNDAETPQEADVSLGTRGCGLQLEKQLRISYCHSVAVAVSMAAPQWHLQRQEMQPLQGTPRLATAQRDRFAIVTQQPCLSVQHTALSVLGAVSLEESEATQLQKVGLLDAAFYGALSLQSLLQSPQQPLLRPPKYHKLLLMMIVSLRVAAAGPNASLAAMRYCADLLLIATLQAAVAKRAPPESPPHLEHCQQPYQQQQQPVVGGGGLTAFLAWESAAHLLASLLSVLLSKALVWNLTSLRLQPPYLAASAAAAATAAASGCVATGTPWASSPSLRGGNGGAQGGSAACRMCSVFDVYGSGARGADEMSFSAHTSWHTALRAVLESEGLLGSVSLMLAGDTGYEIAAAEEEGVSAADTTAAAAAAALMLSSAPASPCEPWRGLSPLSASSSGEQSNAALLVAESLLAAIGCGLAICNPDALVAAARHQFVTAPSGASLSKETVPRLWVSPMSFSLEESSSGLAQLCKHWESPLLHQMLLCCDAHPSRSAGDSSILPSRLLLQGSTASQKAALALELRGLLRQLLLCRKWWAPSIRQRLCLALKESSTLLRRGPHALLHGATEYAQKQLQLDKPPSAQVQPPLQHQMLVALELQLRRRAAARAYPACQSLGLLSPDKQGPPPLPPLLSVPTRAC